jgi:disulfide oxidoreductase YuzD
MQEETGVLVLEKIVANGITYYVIQIDEFIVLETYAELKKVYSGVKDTIESISQQENLHQLVK